MTQRRILPQWCKAAKCALIMKDMKVVDLSQMIGISRVYTSQVVNGMQYAPEIASKISEVLDIETPYPSSIL